jgi:RHS repeat-associated protein
LTFKNDLVNPSNDQTYTYDSLNRLTGYNSVNYTLDALGNMTNYGGHSHSFDGQNELASDGSSWTPGYDFAGELTTNIPTPSYPTTHLTHDTWRRVVQINGTHFSWEYISSDTNGNRYSVDNVTGGESYNTTFSPSGQALEDDTSTSSSTGKVTYVWGELYVNDLVSEDQTSATQPQTSAHIYVEHDANFNVTSLLWYNGSSTRARFNYDPYGVLLSWQYSTSDDENFLYQGGRFDQPTGTYLFGARIYLPSLGVWNREDPFGYYGSFDLYQFGNDAPANFLDPAGTSTYRVYGPWAMSIGWIQSTSGQGLMNLAANPGPPPAVFDLSGATAPSPGGWMAARQYRNVLTADVFIDCDCDTHTVSKVHHYAHQSVGYTPFAGLTLKGQGRVKTWTSRLPGNAGAGFIFTAKFKVNQLENDMQALIPWHSGRLPWAWTRMTYILRCDGTSSVRFTGSSVPSRDDYVDWSRVGGYRMALNPGMVQTFMDADSHTLGP